MSEMGCGGSKEPESGQPDGSPRVAPAAAPGEETGSFNNGNGLSKAQIKASAKNGGEAPFARPKVRRNSFSANEISEAKVKGASPSLLDPKLVGMHSNHGHKPDGRGNAEIINQDRGMVSFPLGTNANQMLVGVYDGHGKLGNR